MAKHRLSQANDVYQGKAKHGKLFANNGGSEGIPIHFLTKVSLGVPDTADADGVAQAQAVAAAGNLTLNGAYVASGVATLDVPRNIRIVSSDAGDTTQTATITGTDTYGETVVERKTFNGTTVVPGLKAFKTVSQVAISATMTGNATVGTADVFGLPYKLSSKADALFVQADGVNELATSTVVAADTTSPATLTTGDVRGTVDPATAANDVVSFTVWMFVSDKDEGALGVTQYGG